MMPQHSLDIASMSQRLLTAVCGCGSRQIIAVQPGYEGARRGAVDIATRRDPIVDRPVPDVLWCGPCWSKRFRPTVKDTVA